MASPPTNAGSTGKSSCDGSLWEASTNTSTSAKAIALTFDDEVVAEALDLGNDVKVPSTADIVKVLREKRVPAAFFVTGKKRGSKGDGKLNPVFDVEYSEADKQLLHEIAEGPLFEIGNHSNTHRRMTEIDRDNPENNLNQALLDYHDAANFLREEAGCETHFFRFPYGSEDCDVAREIAKNNINTIGWTTDCQDWCFGAASTTLDEDA
ncbi:MAG: polysaccharide deacetylase family protein, partial [Polyangiales bacterium]